MSDRKWVKGANGLWTSYDRVIQRQIERAKAKAEKEAKAMKDTDGGL